MGAIVVGGSIRVLGVTRIGDDANATDGSVAVVSMTR